MVLANSVSARLMDGQPFWMTGVIGFAVIAGAALLNGLVGWVIVRSRVPDIIVTLSTLFVFSGVALMVLPTPGGGTSGGFRWIFTGSESGVGTNFVPSLFALALPVAVVGIWLRRTRRGLSLYAVGSDRDAAYLSGVDIGRAKITAYAIAGAFAGLAGLAITAITATGDPRFTNAANGTLNSVAAVVLGGIALAGGVGSVVGAVAAGVILFILYPILTAMSDRPEHRAGDPGTAHRRRDDVGGPARAPAPEERMSTVFRGTEPGPEAGLGVEPPAQRAWMRFLSERPLIVLGRRRWRSWCS